MHQDSPEWLPTSANQGACCLTATLPLADPQVDAAYVNAIHVTHKDLAIAMLEGGKHVLSEKPIAVRYIAK